MGTMGVRAHERYDGSGKASGRGSDRGATTAKKLSGTKVWVPTPGRLRLAPGVGCGCERGSPLPAVRVWGYHPRKIFENSDAKSYILVTTCCEISCFL